MDSQEKIDNSISMEELDLENEMIICNINKDKEAVFNRIKNYSSNMDLLESDLYNNIVSQEEYDFYMLMTDKLKKKQELKNTKIKTLIYTMTPNNNSGFVSSVLLGILVMVLTIIFTLLVF